MPYSHRIRKCETDYLQIPGIYPPHLQTNLDKSHHLDGSIPLGVTSQQTSKIHKETRGLIVIYSHQSLAHSGQLTHHPVDDVGRGVLNLIDGHLELMWAAIPGVHQIDLAFPARRWLGQIRVEAAVQVHSRSLA